jgi:hypothetical protein
MRFPALSPSRVRAAVLLVLVGTAAGAWIFGYQRHGGVDLHPLVQEAEITGLWLARRPDGLTSLWLYPGDARFSFADMRVDPGKQLEVDGRWRAETLGAVRVRLSPGGRAMPTLVGDPAVDHVVAWEAAQPVTFRVIRVHGRLQMVPDFHHATPWDRRPGLVKQTPPKPE